MKNFIIAALALGVSVPVFAEQDDIYIPYVDVFSIKSFASYTGNDLIGDRDKAFGMGLISAVAGSMYSSYPKSACFSTKETLGQLLASVEKYLEDNPRNRSLSLTNITTIVVLQDYGCPNDVTAELSIFQAHPDAPIIKTSKRYKKWLSTKSESFKAKANSYKSSDVIEVLNEYKRHLYK